MRGCLLLLLILSTAVASRGQEFELSGPDSFESFKPAAVRKVGIAGKTLATIRSGDVVSPKLSPDGNNLAYSKVRIEKEMENTAVSLFNLNRRRTSVLLSPAAARKYATYAAFVTEMKWLDNRRLFVSVSDGDVDRADLIFDAPARRLLKQTFSNLAGDGSEGSPPPLADQYRIAAARGRLLFPAIPADMYQHVFSNFAFLAADSGIVLQKNHAGHDQNIWLMDFQSKTMRPLVKLPETTLYNLRGGAAFGPSIIFLVAYDSAAYLFHYRHGRVAGLMKTRLEQDAEVLFEPKHTTEGEVMFLLRTRRATRKDQNSFWIFDGNRLSQVVDFPELYDVDVAPDLRRIAFCFWEKSVRRISVNELRR